MVLTEAGGATCVGDPSPVPGARVKTRFAPIVGSGEGGARAAYGAGDGALDAVDGADVSSELMPRGADADDSLSLKETEEGKEFVAIPRSEMLEGVGVNMLEARDACADPDAL